MANRRGRWFLGIGAVLFGLLLWVLRPEAASQDGDVDTDSAAQLERRGDRADVNGKDAKAFSPVQKLATDRGGSIAGRITSDNGEGVAARVCTRASNRDLSPDLTRDPICTVASADGSYRIEKLWPGDYEVAATAPTFIPTSYVDDDRWYGLRLASGQHKTGVDIVLESGGVEIRGRVRDLSGGEVEGAWVSTGGGSRWGDRGGEVPVRTDAEGNFSIWVRPGSVSLDARAEGYAKGWASGVAPGHFFELLLTPESVLRGRVVLAGTQTPVEGARVSAGGSSYYGSDAVTGPDGTFRIGRLQPGNFKPVADTKDGHGMATSSVLLGLAETSEPVTIELHKVAYVSGKVVRADGGGCEEGRVSLATRSGDDRYSGRVEPDGSVVIRAVLPGTYRPSVYCHRQVGRNDYAEIVVEDEAIENQSWAVAPGLTLRGIVVDPTGAPVAGVTVQAKPQGLGPRDHKTNGWGSTKRDGTFELKSLLVGTYEVTANGSEEFIEAPEPQTVEVRDTGAPPELRFELGAGGTVEGDVIDEDGKPVTNITVRIRGDRWSWGGRSSIKTDDEGHFKLTGLAAGNYRVLASTVGWGRELRAPGKKDDDVQGEAVSVRVGEVSHVNLTVEARSGRISGVVVDATGAPVSDAFISSERTSDSAAAQAGSSRRSVRWGNWGKAPTMTDVDGRFELDELSPGIYTVMASRKGGGEAVLEGVELEQDVTLKIAETGSVSGRVLGLKPERFSVSLWDEKAGTRRHESYYRVGDEWTIDNVPAGTYEVALTCSEGRGVKKGIAVAEGAQVEGADVELAARGTVRGRLVDLETGKPIPGIKVIGRARNGGFSFSFDDHKDDKSRSGEDGRFEVPDLPAGRVILETFSFFEDDDAIRYGRPSFLAQVEPGKTTDAGDLKMPRARTEKKERGGDLGFKLKRDPPGVLPEEAPYEVAVVRPDGPAASSGLKPGDVIVSVDGHDVSGTNFGMYRPLTQVGKGQSVKLGLARGAEVTITAGPPL